MAALTDLPATLTLTLDGYTDLPSGILAAVTTYLDMTERPPRRPLPDRPDLGFARLDVARDPAALAEYRDLYD
ncbi:hypothetical protein J8J40_27560, partial [Mycobacterium tuberculosis]|nr:hypothetical protein [Mycobacterium tuberculosis]MBP0650811.1 hypothetical protein [Mycobacterium tuberculosis]